MKILIYMAFIGLSLTLSCEHQESVTPPAPPESPQKHLVTFTGRAYLDGQPDPVNALHLPLHYDIQIISYLPGDTTSYDTVYTDSSGVYTSTKLRQDGMYDLVARYPYYRLDTIKVEVKEGQVVGSMPELHCQRLIRYSIQADSLVYHSLQSTMILDEYVTNLSSEFQVTGAFDLKELMVRNDSLSQFFFTFDPNFAICGQAMRPGQTYHNRRARWVGQFSSPIDLTPTTGSYFLYAMPRRWPECAFIIQSATPGDVIGSPHYHKKWHWVFKLIEPTRVDIKLE